MRNFIWTVTLLLTASISLADSYVLIPKFYFSSENNIEATFYAQSLTTNRREILYVTCYTDTQKMFVSLKDKHQSMHFSNDAAIETDCRKAYETSLVGQTFHFYNVEKKLEETFTFTKIQMNEFEKNEREALLELNKTFYHHTNEHTELQEAKGNLSFHWGRKTQKVFVFLHGLGLSSHFFYSTGFEVFQAGHNVIVGNLPAHDGTAFLKAEALAGSWLLYAEYIARLAREYGDEVIFVGHSLGGQLSIRAAEMGLVDQLYLVQPLLKVTLTSKVVTQLKSILPSSAPEDLSSFLNAGSQSDVLTKLAPKPIPAKMKVTAYLTKFDPVVDNATTLKWIEQYAPQTQTIESFHVNPLKGHMRQPKDLAQDLLK